MSIKNIINGSTEIYGILADPIHHVAAPELINKMFEKHGENKVLIPFHVDANSLKSVVDGLKKTKNFKGAVITMPHKSAIIKLLDHKSDAVTQVNACNVIKKNAEGELIGDMLDGEGFVKGLEASNFQVSNKSVFLIGSGGAASGISFVLCKNDIRQLYIYNRTKQKADGLINSMKNMYPAIDILFADKLPENLDLLINATSAGMNEFDKLPMSLEGLKKSTLVADVITRPEMTVTLKEALTKGCKIHKGIHMLEHQIALMIEFME